MQVKQRELLRVAATEVTSPPPSVRVVFRLENTPFFMLSYTFSHVLMKASSTPSAFFALASTYDKPFSSANACASARSICRLQNHDLGCTAVRCARGGRVAGSTSVLTAAYAKSQWNQ